MTTASLPIAFDERFVADFCRRSGIRRLALFGSVLREDFGPLSDVDVLVEYLPGRHPGLMLFEQQEELAAMLGRAVDLHTAASLSRHFRDRALAGALTIHEQT